MTRETTERERAIDEIANALPHARERGRALLAQANDEFLTRCARMAVAATARSPEDPIEPVASERIACGTLHVEPGLDGDRHLSLSLTLGVGVVYRSDALWVGGRTYPRSLATSMEGRRARDVVELPDALPGIISDARILRAQRFGMPGATSSYRIDLEGRPDVVATEADRPALR